MVAAFRNLRLALFIIEANGARVTALRPGFPSVAGCLLSRGHIALMQLLLLTLLLQLTRAGLCLSRAYVHRRTFPKCA